MSPKNTRTDGHTKYESGTLSKETYLESCRMRVSDGENKPVEKGRRDEIETSPTILDLLQAVDQVVESEEI